MNVILDENTRRILACAICGSALFEKHDEVRCESGHDPDGEVIEVRPEDLEDQPLPDEPWCMQEAGWSDM